MGPILSWGGGGSAGGDGAAEGAPRSEVRRLVARPGGPCDVIGVEEFAERLCRIGAEPGPRAFPRRRRDRAILMRSFVLLLDGSRSYSEREIDAWLRRWKREVAPAIETDHVSLRRILVDQGQLERTPDGSSYRVGFPPGAVAFELGVYDLDVRATVAAFLELRERAARERGAGRTRAPQNASRPRSSSKGTHT